MPLITPATFGSLFPGDHGYVQLRTGSGELHRAEAVVISLARKNEGASVVVVAVPPWPTISEAEILISRNEANEEVRTVPVSILAANFITQIPGDAVKFSSPPTLKSLLKHAQPTSTFESVSSETEPVATLADVLASLKNVEKGGLELRDEVWSQKAVLDSLNTKASSPPQPPRSHTASSLKTPHGLVGLAANLDLFSGLDDEEEDEQVLARPSRSSRHLPHQRRSRPVRRRPLAPTLLQAMWDR